MSKVFHYAPWSYLPKIVTSGALQPSNAAANGEKPMLWFSAHQRWEPTATKMLRLSNGAYRQMTLQEQSDRYGCIRFGLPAADPRLLDWGRTCALAGTSRKVRRNLELAGKKRGANPQQWFATAQPVSLTELELEVFVEDAWGPADPAEMAEVWTRLRG